MLVGLADRYDDDLAVEIYLAIRNIFGRFHSVALGRGAVAPAILAIRNIFVGEMAIFCGLLRLLRLLRFPGVTGGRIAQPSVMKVRRSDPAWP